MKPVIFRNDDDTVKKVKAWGVCQTVLGGINPEYYWFSDKADRDRYLTEHDYCDAIRCKKVDADYVFESYDEWLRWNQEN